MAKETQTDVKPIEGIKAPEINISGADSQPNKGDGPNKDLIHIEKCEVIKSFRDINDFSIEYQIGDEVNVSDFDASRLQHLIAIGCLIPIQST